MSRADWAIACVVAALALALRLMFLYSSHDRDWPYSASYQGDAVEWVEYATALDQGKPFEFDLPLRSPAVGYVLHWLQPGEIHGPFIKFKALWCCISALTCGLAYLAFVRSAGRRVALIAATMCIFSFGMYVTSTSLNNEALYTFFLMALVLGWQELLRRPGIVLAAGLGALHGLATLVRQEHTLFMLIMLGVAAMEFWVVDSKFWIARAAPGSQSRIQNPKFEIAILVIVFLSSILTCLPWSLHGYSAIQRFNTITSENPDYEHFKAQWTPEARACIDSLPAFARKGNASFIDEYVIAGGGRVVTPQEIDKFFNKVFDGCVPKPISPWVLISMRGPLDFALANHRDSQGGFSKAALVRFNEKDPALILGRPDHLRLVNEGYFIGFGSITGNFPQWLSNVGAKLSNFSDGITLGFTSANLPIGRGGVRRPVDLITAEPGEAIAWRGFILLLTSFGIGVAIVRRIGAIWMAMIAYKVIVTIFFYGYARQAVSILPAFFFFQAVGNEQIGRWLRPAVRLPMNVVRIAGLVLIALLMCVDVYVSRNQPPLAVDGPQRLAPQWGPDAFESVETVHLEPINSAANSNFRGRAGP